MGEGTVVERMKDFEKIAKNWEKLPERAIGRLEGTMSILTTLFPEEKEDKKIG